MEEIDLKQILSLIWRRKILIIILMIVGAVCGYIYNNYLTTPIYKASTTVILSVKEDNDIILDDGTVTNDDIKTIGNDESNLKVTSRKVNNAKRSRTNEEFVSDKNYMKKTGVEMSKEGIENAKKDGHESKLKSEKQFKNIKV